MFGFARRARTTRVSSRGRVFLRLEDLEGRYALSGDPPVDPIVNPSDGIYLNQAPQIVDFGAQILGGGAYLISGRVIDETPNGLVVTLGGSTSAAGQTATCWEDGTFSLVVQLRTDGTDVGYITARTVDAQGLASNEPQVYVQP